MRIFRYYYYLLPVITGLLFWSTSLRGYGAELEAAIAYKGSPVNFVMFNYLEHYLGRLKELQKCHKSIPDPDVARALNNVGYAYEARRNLRKALSYYEQALAMYRMLHGEDIHEDTAITLRYVGYAYCGLGDLQKGLAYSEQALTMYKQLYGKEPRSDIAESLRNVGCAYSDLGEFRRALEYSEQALAMYRTLHGEDPHEDTAVVLCHVGRTYSYLGGFQKGLEYGEKALTMYKILRHNLANPHVAYCLSQLSYAHWGLGDFKKSLECGIHALSMYRKFYGEKPHKLTAEALLQVGSVYSDLGEFRKVLEYSEQALTMYRTLHGEDPHKDIAAALFYAGRACFYLSRFQKSLKYYKQALAVCKKVEPKNQLDRHPTSYLYYKQALAVCKKVEPKNQLDRHPTSYLYRQIQAVRGDVYKALGRYEKARICYEVALAMGKKMGHYHVYVVTYHDIGNLYHLAALGARKEKARHKYLNKANEAFEAAVAASDASSTTLLVDYANFLLAIGKHRQAYAYLIRVIASRNDGEILSYNLAEQATLPPTLQARINQDKTVTVRAIDYAFYLLLYHYEAFQQAGITPEKTQEAYLAACAQGIKARAGQPGKEKQDALAGYLLASLQNTESVD